MASAQHQEILTYSGTDNLDTLIADVSRLVSLPDVYYRLEALIERPDSSMEEFANLLSTDPDLAARLLRMANSAFYSFPSSIETVAKAVQIIGVRQIRELVLATSVVNAFSQVPLGMVNMRMFWEHAVTVGVFAKAIAQYCKRSQAERFYVAGLLHDVGRLMFFMKLPSAMHDLLIQREAREERLFVLEQEALGYTHADAGARLLQSWRVPDSIHIPIAYHHSPMDSDDYIEVSAAIHIADIWAIRHHRGSSGERFEPYLRQDALDILSLQEYELVELWELTEGDIRNVINQFLVQ